MKLNNKGFTFVEILAVIAIIGILTGIATVGVSKYKEQAKNKDYEALAKSSYNAMEEYMMSHPYEEGATLETLELERLLSNRKDPGNQDSDCDGSVVVKNTSGTGGKMDSGEYTVYLCCKTHMKKYTYPDGKVEDITDTDVCDYVAPDEPEDPEIPTPPEIKTYKLKYNDNGGSGCSSKSITREENKTWGTLCTPTRTGYTFNAWKSGSTTITSSSKATSNITVVANWTPKKVVVTFNCNGGTGGGTQTFTVGVSGNKFNKTCSKTGYTLNGWKKTTSATSNNWSTNSNITDNWINQNSPKITIYAHWTINKYTLTFNKGGGNGTCKAITKNYNTAWGTLCSPTKSGYVFDGWYTATNGGGTKITSSTKATKNLTVYAKWKDKCETVTYKNGTTCSKKCGGGTYNRLAYSTIDNSRCSSKDKSSGGSSCNTTPCTVSCSITYDGTTGDNGWYKGYGKAKLNITTNGTISSKGLKKQDNKLTSGNNITQITINADQTKSMYQGYAKINELSTAATCSKEIGVDTKPPYVYAINHKCNIDVRISGKNHHFKDVYFICITDNRGVGSGVHGGGGTYKWNGKTYSYGTPDYNAEDYCAPHMQGYINGSVYTGLKTTYSFYTSDFAGNKSATISGTLNHNC